MPEHTKAIPKIADLREHVGLTQAQLAVLIGVTTNTIQNWESGKSGVEQIERFLKLCEVLGCNLDDLIEYVSDPDAEEPKAGSFSLEQLRDLRKRWGAEDKTHPKASSTQSTAQPENTPAEHNERTSQVKKKSALKTLDPSHSR